MHENAARALQYYEDLPRRSGRPELRLVESGPESRRARGEAAEPNAGVAGLEPGADVPTVRVEPRRVERRHRDEPPHVERRREAPPAQPRRRREPAPAARVRRPALPERRGTIIAGRHQTVAPRIAGRPDRIAMWAVLLGFFLTAVAAATGHG
jgi:hypothetical protein